MEGSRTGRHLYTAPDVKHATGFAPCAPSMMLDDGWSVIKHSEGTES